MRIAILAAMDLEVTPIKKKILVEREYHQKRLSFYWGEYAGQKIVLVKSGIGKKNSYKALEELNRLEDVVCVINIGLAGGINPKLKIGSLVIPKIIRDNLFPNSHCEVDQLLLGKVNSATQPSFSETNMFFQNTKGNENLVSSSIFNNEERRTKNQERVFSNEIIFDAELITTNNICSYKEKKEILQAYPKVVAVDMESFHIVYWCNKNNVPFICFRAISDTLKFKFPSFDLLANLVKERYSMFDYFYLIKKMFYMPLELFTALSLRRNCLIAARNVEGFLRDYLREF
ncbi:MAG: hypothetical protein V1872_01525 [bacterium]